MTAEQSNIFVIVCCAGPLIIPGALMLLRVPVARQWVSFILTLSGVVLDLTSGTSHYESTGEIEITRKWERVAGVVLMILGILALIYLPEFFTDPPAP